MDSPQDVTTCHLKRSSKKKIKVAAAFHGKTESAVLEDAISLYVEKLCPEILVLLAPGVPADIEPPATWR